jgi:transposase
VPWARHGAGHTRDFDDTVAWLVTHTPKSTVSELLRIAWRSVGSIIERVVADGRAAHDPFEGLTRIGLDEISYKRGHRYLTICVDHASGRLVWAAVGRDKKTLNGFFDLLGPERCAQIRLVSADAAEWIADVVAQRCPNATICIDSFHVVAWATEALDQVRREVWNEARKGGMTQHARELKGSRYALWRNPEDLTRRQEAKLAWIARVNTKLYRAYLMKEQLRIAIRTKGVLSLTMLDEWLIWAQRCRIGPFVELGKKIRKNIAGIEAAMLHNLSNALIESTNTKLRVLHRMAFGFRQPEHLIALALLDRGGYCPPLPGRGHSSAPALAALG